jgi:hypothetical protein
MLQTTQQSAASFESVWKAIDSSVQARWRGEAPAPDPLFANILHQPAANAQMRAQAEQRLAAGAALVKRRYELLKKSSSGDIASATERVVAARSRSART